MFAEAALELLAFVVCTMVVPGAIAALWVFLFDPLDKWW